MNDEARRRVEAVMQADVGSLRKLLAEYAQLDRLDGYTPQARGCRFNYFLGELLRAWGILTAVKTPTEGEIDIAFELDGVRCAGEAKWTTDKADIAPLLKLRQRLRQRLSSRPCSPHRFDG